MGMKEFEGRNLGLQNGRKRDPVLKRFKELLVLEMGIGRHSLKKLDCPVREKQELKFSCPACGEGEGCRRASPP
jgi:hypothetical protein